MSTSTVFTPYVPGTNTVRSIPFKAHKINGFAPEILEAHYEETYGAAIRMLNTVELNRAQFDAATFSGGTAECLIEQEQRLLNEVLLHEVHFDSIGESGGQKLAHARLEATIGAGFGGIDAWRDEFLNLSSELSDQNGWIVLAWNKRLGRVSNLTVTDASAGLFGVDPVLVLDLCTHACANQPADKLRSYCEAFLENIDWQRVGARFEAALSGPVAPSAVQMDTHHQTTSFSTMPELRL